MTKRDGPVDALVHQLAHGSLRRQYSAVLTVISAVLVFVGLATTGSAVWTSLRVLDHSESILALEIANRDVMQDMTDAETGLHAYALTGNEASFAPYELAMNWLPQDLQRLESLAAEHRELADAVAAQDAAASQWLVDYAGVWLQRDRDSRGNLPGDGRLYAIGAQLFDEFRNANEQTHAQISAVTAEIRRETRRNLALGLVTSTLVSVLAIAAVVTVARQLSQRVIQPLTALNGVIDRLRSGESEARAKEAGPEEVRRIAAALNHLAEENLRSRDVESDVLARVAELDRVRSDLVSTVSHELRTPLTSIRGYLEILEDDLGPQMHPQQVSMLGAVGRNLDRLTELISNLLALSRAESPELSLEMLDLRGVVAEVASDLRVMAAGRDISMRTVLPAAPVVLLGDRSQLFRAVSNLASNAVKFSRPGGVVELHMEQDSRDAVIRVVDEGIGIPAADLAGLGSRFYRASNAVKAEIAGTGLGLRIVQTILDNHEGTLQVESVEGEGTTAAIRLPLRRDAPAALEQRVALPT